MRTPSDEQVLAWMKQRYAVRKAEIEALGALIAAMERGEDAQPTVPTRGIPNTAKRARSGEKTTGDYVVEALRASGHPMTKRDLVDALLAAGWKTNANDPSETVRYAIGVLVNQGQVKQAGNHTYVLATAHVPNTYVATRPAVAVVGGADPKEGPVVAEG